MSLVRDLPFIMPAMTERLLATCAALYSTAASTSYTIPIADSTADSLVTPSAETTVFGNIINRLRFPLGTIYDAVAVNGYIQSTRGSTEADRKLTVGVRLLHGDSSGGGDLAELSTASRPAVRQYFSTARTTDMAQWDASESTGPVYAPSNTGYYDLRGAGQYLQVAVSVFKNKVTTESSGDEQSRVGGTLAFLAGRVLPQRGDTTGPFSSSTTT